MCFHNRFRLLLISSAQLLQNNANSPVFERKVPPRTPDQRLGTLQRFLNVWINEHIGKKRGERATNWIQRQFFGGDEGFEKHKLLTLYFKQDAQGFPLCSYYNPSNLHHAGPRLDSEPRHYERQANFEIGLYDHLNRRKRRSLFGQNDAQTEILLDQLKLVKMLPANGTEGIEGDVVGRRNNKRLTGIIQNREDFFDLYDMALELDRSMSALRKLSDDTKMSWKQIRMGFLKWIARYTADCPKERERQEHTALIMDFFEKLMMLHECLYEGKTPPEAGRFATARVKFIYGVTVSAEEEKQYNEELSFLIEPPKCTVNEHMMRVGQALRRRKRRNVF